MPSASSAPDAILPRAPTLWMSAIRAMMPPSASLSTRMMSATYLMETTIVIAQKTREIMP
jgi:hypothetical protein